MQGSDPPDRTVNVGDALQVIINNAFSEDMSTRDASTAVLMQMRETDFVMLFREAVKVMKELENVEKMRVLVVLKMLLSRAEATVIPETAVSSFVEGIQQNDFYCRDKLNTADYDPNIKRLMIGVLTQSLIFRVSTLHDSVWLEEIVNGFSAVGNEEQLLWCCQVILGFTENMDIGDEFSFHLMSVTLTSLGSVTRHESANALMRLLYCVLGNIDEDGFEVCTAKVELLEIGLRFIGNELTVVPAMSIIRRVLKYTCGEAMSEVENGEKRLVEALAVISRGMEQVEIILALCRLINSLMKNVYCDGNVPSAYSAVIIPLYRVLLKVDDSCNDHSDWTPEMASLFAIMRHARTMNEPDAHAVACHSAFCGFVVSPAFTERYVAVVMMSAAMANTKSASRCTEAYMPHIFALLRDPTARVREQALHALIDGLNSWRAVDAPNQTVINLATQMCTNSRHLCDDDNPQIRGLMISLYRVVVAIQGFPCCADVFAIIWRVVPHLSDCLTAKKARQICRMITTTHISFLPSISVLLEVIGTCCSAPNANYIVQILCQFVYAVLMRFSPRHLQSYSTQIGGLLAFVVNSPFFVAGVSPFALFLKMFPTNESVTTVGIISKSLSIIQESPDDDDRELCFQAMCHIAEGWFLSSEARVELCFSLLRLLELHAASMNRQCLARGILAVVAVLGNSSTGVFAVVRMALLGLSSIIPDMAVHAISSERDILLFEAVVVFLSRLAEEIEPPQYFKLFGETVALLLPAVVERDYTSATTASFIIIMAKLKDFDAAEFMRIVSERQKSLLFFLSQLQRVNALQHASLLSLLQTPENQ